MNSVEDRGELSPLTVLPVLLATLFAFHAVGPGPALPAPVLSLEAWERWVSERAPVDLAFAALRVAAMVTCYHLLAMQLVAVAARVVDRPNLLRLANRFTPPPLRTSARRLAGIGLTAVTSVTVSATGAGASEPAAGLAMMQVVEVGPRAGTATAVLRVDPNDARTGSHPATSAPAPAPSPEPAPADPEPPSAPVAVSEPEVDPGTDREHVVQPGDHLWSIAAAEVAIAVAEPDPSSIERYWERLVLANPQLDDADLVFPGDVILLPPVGQTG